MASDDVGVIRPGDNPIGLVRHYFYFSEREAANALQQVFEQRHVSATVDLAADGSSWGLYVSLVDSKEPNRLEEIAKGFAELAEKFGGEYHEHKDRHCVWSRLYSSASHFLISTVYRPCRDLEARSLLPFSTWQWAILGRDAMV